MRTDGKKQLLNFFLIIFIITIEITILAIYFKNKPLTLLYREPDEIKIHKIVIPNDGENDEKKYKLLVITDGFEIQKIMKEINGSKCKKVNFGSLSGKTIYRIYVGDNKIVEVYDNYYIGNIPGAYKLIDNSWDFIYEFEYEEILELDFTN